MNGIPTAVEGDENVKNWLSFSSANWISFWPSFATGNGSVSGRSVTRCTFRNPRMFLVISLVNLLEFSQKGCPRPSAEEFAR